ncbi:MAG TPA: nucleotidyltransferase family protein [Thermoplasmata archaeon]|nr:nucleotidyltransferase family protein [Thermoplasmata archaeon]
MGGLGRDRAAPAAAVVLAAGPSSRFGGFPKACLDLDGIPAVRRIAEIALDAGLSPVVVVTGPHDPEIGRVLEGAAVRRVPNPEWPRGRSGSVRVGLAHVPAGDDVLLWPVDHPLVSTATVDRLLAARSADPLATWFIPVWQGQPGHPVLFRSEVRAMIDGLDAAAPLRTLLPRLGPQVRRMPVPDPGVVANLDTPDAYRHFVGAWRRGWTVE